MGKRGAASIGMLFGAIIWGAAFVFQSMAMDHIGPFTLGSVRFLLGSLVIAPLLLVPAFRPDPMHNPPASRYFQSGILCGILLFLGVTFQQIGIQYTTAGKAGFVTALYMILVPFLAWILFRQRIKKIMWLMVGISLLGFYFLCMSESFSLGKGDLYVFIGSIFWALQILALKRFCYNLESIRVSIIQFLTCSALSAIPMFLFERPSMVDLRAAAVPILYCGILSVGVAFTAQTICLKHVDAVVATLVMSTESVFSAIFGYFLLGEILTPKQMLGCALVFLAVLVSELLPRFTKPKTAESLPQQ